MQQIQTGGGRLVWKGDHLQKAVIAHVGDLLLAACEIVRSQAAINVSQSSRANGPSAPGDFPHADTGRLRNSIFAYVDKKGLSGLVGTNLRYGLYLEYGTSGERVVYPSKGRVLSWIGRDGVRRFARSVRIGPIKARSYLRRTMRECTPRLRKIFGSQWKNFRVLA